MTGRRGAPRAFTLLELLVALSITALLAASLLGGLRVAFKARRVAEDGLEPARTADVAAEIIRADLESALPPRGSFSGSFSGGGGLDARGVESDSLAFSATATAPAHVTHVRGNGEVKRVVLEVENPEGTDEFFLVRRVTGNLLSEVEVEPDGEVLCRDVGAFSVRYSADGVEWLDEWGSGEEGRALPAAVAVTLELSRPGPDGRTKVYRFTRTFLVPCSAPPDEPADPFAADEGAVTTP